MEDEEKLAKKPNKFTKAATLQLFIELNPCKKNTNHFNHKLTIKICINLS